MFHIELSFIYNFAFELWASGNLHWFTCLLDQESYLINYLESESSVHDRNIFWFCTKNWFKWSKFLPEPHGVQSTVTREFLRNLSQTTSHQHLVISSKYRPLIGQGKQHALKIDIWLVKEELIHTLHLSLYIITWGYLRQYVY